MDPSFETSTYNPDRLIAGGNVQTQDVTIASGENVARGAVLGKITASGKYVLSDDAAVDGSEVPRAVLAKAVDATAGDTAGHVFVFGEFNANALIFGGTHDAASVKEPLRDVGIIIKTPVVA